MTRQSIHDQLEAARSSVNPLEALYGIAQSLRDLGLPQVDIYHLYHNLFQKHREDDVSYDAIADVIDCIWGGGWGGASQLFDDPLTDEVIRGPAIDVDEWLRERDQ